MRSFRLDRTEEEKGLSVKDRLVILALSLFLVASIFLIISIFTFSWISGLLLSLSVLLGLTSFWIIHSTSVKE